LEEIAGQQQAERDRPGWEAAGKPAARLAAGFMVANHEP